MAQQNNKFSAFFGVTGLSPTINIRDVSGNLVVDNVAMTELGGGWYIYTFTGYNTNVDYVYDFNPNNILYNVQSGVTDNIQQLISEIRPGVGGGGGFINYQSINSHTTKKINELEQVITQKLSEIPQPDTSKVEEQLNEINSHIDIAKSDIIDTIKETENEIASDIIRKSKELKEDNVKTRNLVRQKSEKVVKYAEKQLDRQDKLEQMIEGEADEIERQILEGIEKEAEEIEILYNQSTDGNNNGTEG